MKTVIIVSTTWCLLAAMLGAVPANASAIEGTIVFEGDIPKMPVLDMSADPHCASIHEEPVKAQALVLGDDRKMANIFVQIVDGLPDKDYPVPEEPVVLDQKGCMFAPHVFGVRVGQTLLIKNPDDTLHNVHTYSKVNKGFNIAMPKFKKETSKVLEKAEEMFPIKCDVHPWMSAYCVVVDHPFFTVTGKDGRYLIEGLDPGTYELEARHERLGAQTVTVTIEDDETKTVDLTFKR